jgi:hypothetical protein
MAHHDSNAIVIPERIRREIAEHSQMAMLTINTIFRGVMGMESCHGFAAGQVEVYRTLPVCKAGIFRQLPLIRKGAT